MIIPIVLSADDNYAGPLGVTLYSIWKNKTVDTELEIYVLDGGISATNKNLLNILEKKYNFQINYLKIDLGLFHGLPENNQLKIPVYFRLLAPQLINREKIIYLDSDIIVLQDLSPLFNEDLNGKAFGATQDILKEECLKRLNAKSLGDTENILSGTTGKKIELTDYFNAGVMLINCILWRAHCIAERTIDFVRRHSQKLEFLEQDALNYIFRDDWKKIDQKYNRQLNEYSQKLTGDIHIIHYIGAKPWNFLYGGRGQRVYKKYLAKTPWRDHFYHDKNLKNLIRKTLKIILLRSGVVTRKRNLGHLKIFLKKIKNYARTKFL